MKSRIITLAIVLTAITLAIVPFVYAQHVPHKMGSMGGAMFLGHLSQLKDTLGLSDQQVTDIKAIFTDLKTQNQPYRTQLRGGMGSIAQALINNPNDLTAAQNLLAQQEQAEHAMKANALVAASKALTVLTPDQRTKLSALVASRIAKHEQHTQK